MENAAQVLIIIVSATLAVFLVVLIIAFIYVIKLLRDIQRISTKAEHVVDSVESAASFFERSTPTVALLKSFIKIVSVVTKHKKEK